MTISSFAVGRTSGRLRATLAGLFCLLASSQGKADAVADFYRGRTVTLVIGVGDGGFYDLNGRLLAQYLKTYIPGSPVIVPQNMPGASQLRATEYAYNLAPRDGSSLLVAQPYVILNKLLDQKLKFDVQKLTWLGRVGPLEMGGIVARDGPVRTIEDARRTEIILGANAPNGPAAMIPWALNRLAGTKFHVVRGYQSQTAEELAMERGEIQGIGNGSFGEVPQGEKMRTLYVSASNRLRSRPDIPTIVEVVKDERDRAVMDLLAAISSVGLALIGPPDIPEDRRLALRTAFDQVMRDPGYLGSLGKIGFAADSMSGQALADFIRERFSPSDDLIERLRLATEPQ